jgi:SAM-dependent methyltransferase
MTQFKNPIHALRVMLRNEVMTRGGLQPRGEYWWSSTGSVYTPAAASHLQVRNLVGAFNDVLRCYWEHHGFGGRCLLVSESIRTAEVMHQRYPQTDFLACDLFSELMGSAPEDRPHVTWDVCTPPPAQLRADAFDSVVAHALLEHVIAPTTAMGHFCALLRPGGRLYFMTHTPSFHKHQYPRDYVRFHHDYFEDLPHYVDRVHRISVALTELYSHEGTICGVYVKNR